MAKFLSEEIRLINCNQIGFSLSGKPRPRTKEGNKKINSTCKWLEVTTTTTATVAVKWNNDTQKPQKGKISIENKSGRRHCRCTHNLIFIRHQYNCLQCTHTHTHNEFLFGRRRWLRALQTAWAVGFLLVFSPCLCYGFIPCTPLKYSGKFTFCVTRQKCREKETKWKWRFNSLIPFGWGW